MDLGSILHNRYTLTAKLGKGAMGTVYRAVDKQTAQEVAAKVLSRDLALDHNMLARFRREGEALRQLRHPNIVGFVDMFEHDEQHVIVMEYVPGGNLHDLVQRGPLPLDRARRIALGLCDALTRAHDLNIVHRDLKPENVLLAADGTPKLSDFGVARLVSEGNRITNTGTQLGTPYYMAPEAWEGSHLDAQADIWALGVVLYEMLTGQVPFGGDTLVAVMNKVLNAPLPDMRQLRPDVPPGLVQVVAGMLTRDKARRYASMRLVAADLERGEPTLVRPPLPALAQTRRAQTPNRRRLPLWGCVAGGVIMVGLAISAIVVGPRLLPHPSSPIALRPTSPPATQPAGSATAPIPLASVPAPQPGASLTATVTPLPVSPLTPQMNPSGWQWQPVVGGEKFPAATVNTLAVDPSDPKRVLVGTYGSGIYISTDGGQTWAPANSGLGQGLVSTLAINPKDPKLVYAGMADQGGVYKSTDGGRTWQPVDNGIDLNGAWNWIGVVALDSQDPARVYYSGAWNGLWLSTDAGLHWTLQGDPKSDCVHVVGLAVDPANGQHLYAESAGGGNSTAGCPSGIYESTDSGHTWQRLSTGAMTKGTGASWSLAVDPRDFKKLYAGGDTGTWKSTDGGQHWSEVKPDGCWYLAVNPGDGATYCLLSGNSAVSLDGGQTWQPWAAGASLGIGWDRRPLAFAPSDPKTMYAGYDRLLRSDDNGQSWQPLSNLGARRAQLRVDARDGNRLYLVTGERDQEAVLFLSADGGQTWQPKLNTIGVGRLTIDAAHNVVYYADTWAKAGKAFYRSLDNGQTWQNFGTGDLNKTWQLAPDPQNPARLWAMNECGTRPLRSDDGGQTFKEVADFPQQTCQPILAMTASGQRMYIADWGNFWRSGDGGQTWTGATGPGGYFNTAVVDPSNPDMVYLGSTHLGVQKTSDGGNSWTPANAGLPGAAAVNEIALDPQNSQTLYAATGQGAFVSLNGGEQWQPLLEGLGPNSIVYSIAVDPNDPHRIFAATADGIYRLTGPGAAARVIDNIEMWNLAQVAGLP